MILWLNPSTGLSGDMLLGALLDLGAPIAEVRAAIASACHSGWQLDAERVEGGALRAKVRVEDGAVDKRRATEILDMVSSVSSEPVAAMAARAVTAITKARGEFSDTSHADVELYEIGQMDTVVDIVGVAAAVHSLGISHVYCAPVALGSGEITTRQGTLSTPTPVTLALLKGAKTRGIDVSAETVTPTGAALLVAMEAKYDPMPTMRIERAGYGAGGMTFPGRTNVLQAMLGTIGHVNGTRELILMETNLDDVTGELLGRLMSQLMDTGALDAWTSVAVMKKGRPAHLVHVLCEPGDAPRLQERLFAESGTLGIRTSSVMRTALPRSTVTVDVAGQRVRVKVGPYGAKAEHDDVVSASAASGLPVWDVMARALDASRTN
ncbi:LarC family nickel insertion protein [Streptomyces sp. NPDC048639]|uniref:LarC family nickel insertion protein n=1 Tax=Streptomyces sp. NPDC048639 TaxID=3365581 RepID=UPI00371A5AFD